MFRNSLDLCLLGVEFKSILRVWIPFSFYRVSFFLMFIYFKKFLMFIYFWGRERQSMNGGGSEREGDTQNRKQAPGSELSARSPTRGSNSTDRETMTWAEVGRSTDWATQVPLYNIFKSSGEIICSFVQWQIITKQHIEELNLYWLMKNHLESKI